MAGNYAFTKGRPLPDAGLFGLDRGFQVIKLELTNRCVFKCFFCVAPSLQTRENGDMTNDDLHLFIKHLQNADPFFSGRIILVGLGEALLLKDLHEKCKIIKGYYPNIILQLTSTFGIKKYTRSNIIKLLKSGINSVYVSCYGYDRTSYKKVTGIDAFDIVIHNIRHLCQLQKEFNFHLRFRCDNFNVYPESDTRHIILKEQFLQFLERESAGGRGSTDIEAVDLHNCDYGEVAKIYNETIFPPGSRPVCPVVWGGWANQLCVRWNLNIGSCCVNGTFGYILGNIKNNNLDDVFTAKRYIDFYNKHWACDIDDIPLCRRCDYGFDCSSKAEISRLYADNLLNIINTSKNIKVRKYSTAFLQPKALSLHGYIDSIKYGDKNSIKIALWAIDLIDGVPLSKLYIIVNGEFCEISSAECESRGDVADIYKRIDLKHCGLNVNVSLPYQVCADGNIEQILVVAENSRGERLLLPGMTNVIEHALQ
jgi:MoaA/NifB/PqqE/SkfB family radical SAM enzyme